MKIIRLLVKNSSQTFYLAIISSFIGGASSAGIIAVINYAIAHLNNLAAGIAWLFVFLCFTFLIFSMATLVLMTRLSQEIIYNLRLEMSQKILACPLQHLEIIGAPRLLATLTGDINAIAQASGTVSILIVNLSIFLGILVYLCWLSPSIFSGFIIIVLIGFYTYQLILKQGKKYLILARQTQDVIFTHFRTVTEGTKELKLHRNRRQAFMREDLGSAAADFKRYWIKGMNVFAFANPWGLLLFFIPIGILLFVVPQLANVSTPLITSYILTILYMINPLRVITNALPEITQANIALNKIDSLGLSLSEKTIEHNLTTNYIFTSHWTLKLVNIHHAYRGDKEEHQFSLDNINLYFEPGEIVFIVGGNGSGKSTLIKLITGLYTPDRGKILFDNQSITDNNREWYRQQFSAVFYDFYLFHRLIGIERRKQAEIQDYLNLLELQHKVTVNDGILSTTNLSQGQRKRLALLTAYLEDRPIYVFDEWASDQDPVFKGVFYQKLIPGLKKRGKTVIAVTHDERYFSECDRLIKLDYGRIMKSD